MTNTDIQTAIKFVIDNGNEQAKGYANQARTMFVQPEVYSNDDIAVQIMYMLSNFTGCRAEGSPQVRKTLKAAVLKLSA